MKSSEIRERFLKFFEKRGHKILASAPLVPLNDPTVLFNTAGMQPLVPYLLGEPHPQGKRLASIQKCVRTNDIDEVGDNTHLTFFEMMGNWSLGDYFKKEAIEWSYELLTNKEEGFGLDPRRLYVTCFEGNENAPKDEESASIWREIFKKNKVDGERIYFLSAEKNWWSPGENGPCGPDTEMFYDLTGTLTEGMTKDEYLKADKDQRVVEIWNDVFMEYVQKDGKVVSKLEKKNVDTGSGLERVATVIQGKESIFETDLFSPLMDLMAKAQNSLRNKRIIADHLRASVFLIVDGVLPSNTDQGYILRRLIRRAIISTTDRKLDEKRISVLVDTIVSVYSDAYPDLISKKDQIKQVLAEEARRFEMTLRNVQNSFNEIVELKKTLDSKNSDLILIHKTAIEYYFKDENTINGKAVFNLVQSHGAPIDLIKDFAKENGLEINITDFEERNKKHQELSRSGADKKFKGGLADTSEMSLKYHTATHLLHKALREVLGDHVQQKGSNITPERLRFDFSHPQKMTDDEKKKVEDLVNQKIQEGLPVHKVILSKEEAEKTGALHFFGEKYGDEVSVYYIGNSLDTAFSKEFCGGPHVETLKGLGEFKIQKEEALAQGVRRIKAILK